MDSIALDIENLTPRPGARVDTADGQARRFHSHRPATRTSGLRRSVAVWLPWLAAPAFFLLPIAGCGMAALSRRPPQVARLLPGPVAPAATVVAVSPVAR